MTVEQRPIAPREHVDQAAADACLVPPAPTITSATPSRSMSMPPLRMIQAAEARPSVCSRQWWIGWPVRALKTVTKPWRKGGLESMPATKSGTPSPSTSPQPSNTSPNQCPVRAAGCSGSGCRSCRRSAGRPPGSGWGCRRGRRSRRSRRGRYRRSCRRCRACPRCRRQRSGSCRGGRRAGRRSGRRTTSCARPPPSCAERSRSGRACGRRRCRCCRRWPREASR